MHKKDRNSTIKKEREKTRERKSLCHPGPIDTSFSCNLVLLIISWYKLIKLSMSESMLVWVANKISSFIKQILYVEGLVKNEGKNK